MSWATATLFGVLTVGGVAVAVGMAPGSPRESWRLDAPVLMYHHVQELHGEPAPAWLRYTVSPSAFEAQLQWLHESGYQTITAARLVETLRGDPREDARSLPPKPVVLTFDDGWACCYDTVFPLLKRRGMTATFFVYPSGVDAPGYVTWAQLREMRSAGMDIQAHSMTHPHLPTIPPADAEREIEKCMAVMTEKMGDAPTVFAYPFGEYSDAVIKAVERAGYEGAYSTDPGIEHSAGDAFKLKRVLVSYPDDLDVFGRVVRGGRGG